MSLPERVEPENESTVSSVPAADRPDWLVGAEEGVEEELKRKSLTEADSPAGAPVELRRPEALEPQAPSAGARVGLPLPRMVRPDGGTLAQAEAAKVEAEAKPEKPVAWKGASGSIPKLTIASLAGPPSASPELSQKKSDAEDDNEGFAPPDQGVPVMPGGESDSAPAPILRGPGARAPSKPALDEPWWLVLGERVATDRKVQIAIGAVVVLVLAVILWPKGGNSVAISAIRKHPERFEGQIVTVRGRIGEVFAVGQGHTFYLLEGRDTLVVYTRMRTPVSRQRVQIIGSVTMGYLDGAPRVAVFETGS